MRRRVEDGAQGRCKLNLKSEQKQPSHSEYSASVSTSQGAHYDECCFAVTPTRFCQLHQLSACQVGVVRALSSYQFEKDPNLLDRAGEFAALILEFDGPRFLSPFGRLAQRCGMNPYLAPREQGPCYSHINLSTYCLINGISSSLALPLGLICRAPTEDNIRKAISLIQMIKAGHQDTSPLTNRW